VDLGIPEADLQDLSISSFLHDVGLVAIQENLDYPKHLTNEIKKEVMRHPERSAALLAGAVSETVQQALLQHHELPSGRGYPMGLEADKIHLFAKIINAVDSFEAMTHERPYRRRPFDVSQAVKEMVEKERGLYDRDVMKALLNCVGLYPVQSLVELSNKQVARILRQNRLFPLSPVVQIEFDEEGNKLKQMQVLDLMKSPLVHIIGPLHAVPSISKERLEKHHHRSDRKAKTVTFMGDLIPFVIITTILLLLIFFVLKV
jgi:hypothetical protein